MKTIKRQEELPLKNTTEKSAYTRRRSVPLPPQSARDIAALTWMAHQQAIRMDHLHLLLEQLSHQPLALSTAYSVVFRWRNAGWVKSQKIYEWEPGWVWPTRRLLRQLNLPYRYKDMGQCAINLHKELAAINEIRLQECTNDDVWVSQRQLLEREGSLPNVPDAQMRRSDGQLIAIKVEISLQGSGEQTEFLTALLRGEGEPYSEIWYVAPVPEVRRHIRQTCRHLQEQGILTDEEALRICIKGYNQEDDEVLEKQVKPQVDSVAPGRHRRSRIRRQRIVVPATE